MKEQKNIIITKRRPGGSVCWKQHALLSDAAARGNIGTALYFNYLPSMAGRLLFVKRRTAKRTVWRSEMVITGFHIFQHPDFIRRCVIHR